MKEWTVGAWEVTVVRQHERLLVSRCRLLIKSMDRYLNTSSKQITHLVYRVQVFVSGRWSDIIPPNSNNIFLKPAALAMD
jgi:hypothetical protein